MQLSLSPSLCGHAWHLLLRDLPLGYSACVSWVMNHRKGRGVSKVKDWTHQIVDSVSGRVFEGDPFASGEQAAAAVR